MKRRERDFVALFNTLWCRDFPVTPGHEDLGRRAVWTTHIAFIFKQSADLMGFFTCFESGGRTDAVTQTAVRDIWAKIEWEWIQPHSKKVNEIEKLATAAKESEVMIFIGYSRSDFHDANLEKIDLIWEKINKPLIVFLVTFSFHNKRRHFEFLQTHYFKDGKRKMLRKQPALPWQVKDTKWAALARSAISVEASTDEESDE